MVDRESELEEAKSYPDSLLLEQVDDCYPLVTSNIKWGRLHGVAVVHGMNIQVDPMIFLFFSGSVTPSRRLRKSSPASTTVRLIPRCFPSVSLTSSHSLRRISPMRQVSIGERQVRIHDTYQYQQE